MAAPNPGMVNQVSVLLIIGMYITFKDNDNFMLIFPSF